MQGRRFWAATRLRIAVAALVMLCLAAGLLPAVLVPAAGAKTRAEINQALDQNEQKLDQTRVAIRKAEEVRSAALDDIAVLDQRISGLEGELETVTSDRDAAARELAATEAEHTRLVEALAQKKAELQRAESDLVQAQDALSARAVNIYKTGGFSYLEALFDTRRLIDLINRLDLLSLIIRQDQQLLTRVEELRARVAAEKAALYEQETQLAAVEERQQAQTAALNQLVSEQASKLAKLDSARDDKRAVLAKAEKDKASWEKQEDALLADSARLETELRALTSTSTEVVKGTGRLIMPVNGRISSPFGYRVHPIFQVRKLHTGIDISASSGTPIKAADSGVVVQAGWRGGYGQAVVISHGDGIATLYAHQSKILVGVGDRVEKGDVIGKVGSTGYSTGPHLHFEVRVNGSPVDPMRYL